MTRPQLVIRGDWRGFALCLEPAGAIVEVFNTLSGAARAAALGAGVLSEVKALLAAAQAADGVVGS